MNNLSHQIGAHTVFARGEKCLYFRYVSVSHTHTACFALYNRNVIPADVELTLLTESLAPAIVKLDTFVVTPERERIPPTSHKRFAISFNPTLIEVTNFSVRLKDAAENSANLEENFRAKYSRKHTANKRTK